MKSKVTITLTKEITEAEGQQLKLLLEEPTIVKELKNLYKYSVVNSLGENEKNSVVVDVEIGVSDDTQETNYNEKNDYLH